MQITPRFSRLALYLLLTESQRLSYWKIATNTSYADSLARYIALTEGRRRNDEDARLIVKTISDLAHQGQRDLIENIPDTPPLTPEQKLDLFDKTQSYKGIVRQCSEILNGNS